MVVMLMGEFGTRFLRNQVMVDRRVASTIVVDVRAGHIRKSSGCPYVDAI